MESIRESSFNQSQETAASELDHENMSTFRRVRWSILHGLIALGVIVIFRLAFYLLGMSLDGKTLYQVGMVLWISMFGWMLLVPLYVALRQRAVLRPKLRLIVKEIALAIPLALGLIILQALTVLVLRGASGSAVEANPRLSQLRGVPGDVRLYVLLIAMFTLGPLAEELFFRGLVYNLLRRFIRLPGAIMLQAIVFMLVHYKCPESGLTALGAVFVAGFVLAGIYEWRKSLWSPIAVHSLTNLAFVIPVTALIILNSHTPARTWEEAKQPPDWLDTDLSGIEMQASGEQQRLHAINTWGSGGYRMWKEEIRAFEAVCEWFPNDRTACAQARVGISQIYLYYLRDLRRAVVQSDRVLSEYEDQPETCAQALLIKAQSYKALGDLKASDHCLREVLESYPSIDWVCQSAQEELELLEIE